MNDWRAIAGPKPPAEPCRICGNDHPKEVSANKALHPMAAVCNSCASDIFSVHVQKLAFTQRGTE